MCTLAVYRRAFEHAPLVVAANRDEFYDRPTAPPGRLSEDADAFGGRDLVHAGTWLGVNPHGVLAALLNRRTARPVDARLRSRGLLCLDALRHETAERAVSAISKTLTPGDYNPFNLLVADEDAAWVVTNNGFSTGIRVLDKDLHLLSNLDVDDPECPRIAASTIRFAELGRAHRAEEPRTLVDEFQRILADHGTSLDPRDPGPAGALCVHLGTYGTRSSSLLFRNRTRRWSYLHAPGAPCEHPLEVVQLPRGY